MESQPLNQQPNSFTPPSSNSEEQKFKREICINTGALIVSAISLIVTSYFSLVSYNTSQKQYELSTKDSNRNAKQSDSLSLVSAHDSKVRDSIYSIEWNMRIKEFDAMLANHRENMQAQQKSFTKTLEFYNKNLDLSKQSNFLYARSNSPLFEIKLKDLKLGRVPFGDSNPIKGHFYLGGKLVASNKSNSQEIEEINVKFSAVSIQLDQTQLSDIQVNNKSFNINIYLAPGEDKEMQIDFPTFQATLNTRLDRRIYQYVYLIIQYDIKDKLGQIIPQGEIYKASMTYEGEQIKIGHLYSITISNSLSDQDNSFLKILKNSIQKSKDLNIHLFKRLKNLE